MPGSDILHGKSMNIFNIRNWYHAVILVIYIITPLDILLILQIPQVITIHVVNNKCRQHVKIVHSSKYTKHKIILISDNCVSLSCKKYVMIFIKISLLYHFSCTFSAWMIYMLLAYYKMYFLCMPFLSNNYMYELSNYFSHHLVLR